MISKKTLDCTHKGVVLWGTKNIFHVLPLKKYDEYIAKTLSLQDVLPFVVECRIKGKRHKDGNLQKKQNNSRTALENNTFLTAMDYVEFVFTDTAVNSLKYIRHGLIVLRVPRKNYIERKKGVTRHVVAVNLDILGIVLSVGMPAFGPRFADKLICITLEQNINPLVIINKIDLLSKQNDKVQSEIKKRIDVYQKIGIDVIKTSVAKNTGMTRLLSKCKKNICAFVGQSGVGKSSIINTLVPHASQSIGEISKKYNRGRHTTTRPEVILGNQLTIVDTPGIRDLYPTEITAQNISIGYPEIANIAPLCKLSNCLHNEEPECAVKKEVGNTIFRDRYQSYITLLNDICEWEKNKWYRNKQ